MYFTLKTTNYSTESISVIGAKWWDLVPIELKNIVSIYNFIFYYITSCILEQFYLHCSDMFSLVSYGFHLVMLQVTNTACWNSSSQKSVLRSLPLKSIMLPSRIEICSLALKFQWQILQEII